MNYEWKLGLDCVPEVNFIIVGTYLNISCEFKNRELLILEIGNRLWILILVLTSQIPINGSGEESMHGRSNLKFILDLKSVSESSSLFHG